MLKRFLEIYAKLSKRERAILAGTAMILSFFLTDKLIVGPTFRDMMSLDQRVRDEEAAIKKSLHVLLRKEQIGAEGKQFASFSVDAKKNSEEEMTALLKEIEAIADKASVSLLYVRPGNITEESGIRKFYATLECEAEMEQVASFLHHLENSTDLLQVDKYELQPKSKDSGISRCSMTVVKTVLLS